METIAKQNLCWKRVFALIKKAQNNIICKLSWVFQVFLCATRRTGYNNHNRYECLTPTAE